MAQRVKLQQNDPRAAPSVVTQPFSLSALSTDFTLRRLLDAVRLPGRTEWARLPRFLFSTLRGENLRKRARGGIGSSKRAAGNGARCQMAFSAVVFEVKNVSGQANRTAAWIRICFSRGNTASAIHDDLIQSLKKQVFCGLVFLRFAYASLLAGASTHLAILF